MSEQSIDTLNHLQVAKKFMEETNGTHPTEFIKAKALSAIVEALIYIAENGVENHEHH